MRDRVYTPRYIMAHNQSNFDIPAYGIVEINYINPRPYGYQLLYAQVRRPTSDGIVPIAVNSWMPIKANRYGLVCIEGITPLLVTPGTASTVVGAQYGAASGSFVAVNGTPGLISVASNNVSAYANGIDSVITATFPDDNFKYKEFATLKLEAALTTATASVAATVTVQYGPGKDSPFTASSAVTAHNPQISGGYMFSGLINTYVLGRMIDQANYLIVSTP